MSIADDKTAFAALCQAAAQRALQARIQLGQRPEGPASRVVLWEQRSARLRGQTDNLAALAIHLAAEAVDAALAEAADDLRRLGTVTAEAQARLDDIAEVANLLTTFARILDVGLALVAIATEFTPGHVKAGVDAIEALADQVRPAEGQG